MFLTRKTAIPDLMFVVQVVIAFYFSGHLMIRALVDLTGTSIVQTVLVAIYLLMLYRLAQGAHRSQSSRLSLQNLIAIGCWLILSLGVITCMLWGWRYKWSLHDTLILAVAGISAYAIVEFAPLGTNFKDPHSRGLFAIAFKSVPQVFLAWKIWEQGGSGIPLQAILIAYGSVISRFVQIGLMYKEKKADPNRFWLLTSEICNGSSWGLVTIAWALRYYHPVH